MLLGAEADETQPSVKGLRKLGWLLQSELQSSCGAQPRVSKLLLTLHH